jgi:hypothetical protein
MLFSNLIRWDEVAWVPRPRLTYRGKPNSA